MEVCSFPNFTPVEVLPEKMVIRQFLPPTMSLEEICDSNTKIIRGINYLLDPWRRFVKLTFMEVFFLITFGLEVASVSSVYKKLKTKKAKDKIKAVVR